jgi:hypothetical protein
MPIVVPLAATMIDSDRIELRSWARVMPTERSSPISGVRSVTERINVFHDAEHGDRDGEAEQRVHRRDQCV